MCAEFVFSSCKAQLQGKNDNPGEILQALLLVVDCQTDGCGGMSVAVGCAPGACERSELLLSQERESTVPVAGGERALGCWKGGAGSFGLQGPAGFVRAAVSVERETGAAL